MEPTPGPITHRVDKLKKATQENFLKKARKFEENDFGFRARAFALSTNVFISICLVVVTFQIDWMPDKSQYQTPDSDVTTVLKTCTTTLSVLLFFQIIEMRWATWVSSHKKHGSCGWLANPLLYLELVLSLLHATPEIILPTNNRWNCWVLLRSYLWLHMLFINTPQYKARHLVRTLTRQHERFPEAARYVRAKTRPFGARTIIKTVFHEYPWTFLGVLFCWTLPLLTYTIMIAERERQPVSFGTFRDTLWFVGGTMATVGYGGEEPLTVMARIVSFLACILGTILTSLLVVVLVNDLMYSDLEVMSMHTWNKSMIQDHTPKEKRASDKDFD